METQDNISVKAKYQNEIRRFALPANSPFSTLSTTLSNLLSISDPIVIKYLDDENDLCTISTQEEFNFAKSMMGKNPLRVQVFIAGQKTEEPPKPAAPQQPVSQLSANTPAFHFPGHHFLPESSYRPGPPGFPGHPGHHHPPPPHMHHHVPFHPESSYRPGPHHHHWGNRWGGNQSDQQGNHERPRMTKCERMEAKSQALTEKKNFILTQLADESLNSERRRVLTWKLQKLEEKVKFLEARKEYSASQETHWGRGRGGRRGCWGDVQNLGAQVQQPQGSVTPVQQGPGSDCVSATPKPEPN